MDLLERPVCPLCGKAHVIKFGKKSDKQRYKRKDCGKVFVMTTKTILASFIFRIEGDDAEGQQKSQGTAHIVLRDKVRKMTFIELFARMDLCLGKR